MTLNELKKPYEKNYDKKLDEYNCYEIAEMYLASSSNIEKDKYISYLICKTWNLISKIHRLNSSVLSFEECYDIFIQTLQYVINSHPWTNKDNSLYGDDKAFEKAMSVTIQSRRKNYLKAKFTQKRVLNINNISLEGLEEDFQEGYFSSYNEDFSELCIPEVENQIAIYFKQKKYIAAFILDAIMFYNIYDCDSNFDIRKLRKYLRHIDNNFCKYFAKKYSLNEKEVIHSLSYFKDKNQSELDTKIALAFINLKQNESIKSILNR